MPYLHLLLIPTLLSLSLSANTIRDSKSSTMANKQGFYYYQDPQDANKTKKIPASPIEKAQAEKMDELIKTMKENNELQKKILKRLLYAFPDTVPEYTINKKTGKKCKTNSSADCFVMPVIKEAQNSVPVMATMLRNPSSQNVKNYLEWQGTYFNQAFKIGNGFSLVSKQYGRSLTNIDGMGYTQMPLEGSRQNDIGNIQKAATFKKLDDKLGIMLFVGLSREHERNMMGYEYVQAVNTDIGKMKNVTYVFRTQEDKKYVEMKIRKTGVEKHWKTYRSIRNIVSKEYYDKFNITLTPSTVAIYKTDKKEKIWQKLGYTINARAIATTLYDFLSFNGIVKNGALREDDNWRNAQALREGKKIDSSFIDSIDINETSISVTDDQYLDKPKKAKAKNENTK